ncbi:DUF2231 domain-containing protein [Actinoplanes hulinensis]|uniref:DUF2231 domain-containing protein n=1 Tax=Actinoplanes hulinensis TaxID=1144547 RepID=A0ABS7BC88_9ACTN|nr:DUF2231 domain-containing protein [Actinoplanes hulinensis]MBW6438706.1 DUF2231 domain-containing protein [Actinoplanes hulinensis]
MTGRRHTQSRLRLAGSGVQPLLLMFPLGLFWMAFVFDLATTLGAPPLIGTVAFWNLVAGLIGGLLAALAAAVDAFGASDPAAARIFFLALLLDVGVLIVFAVLTLMRVRGHDRSADGGLLALEAAALALAGFTAWFSGRLADPQAPVSDPRLSHRRGAGLLDLDPSSEYPGQQSENPGRRSEFPVPRSESAVPRSESAVPRTRDSSRAPADPGARRKDSGTSSPRRRETAVPAPRPSHGRQAAGRQPTPPQRGRTAVPETRGRGPAAVEREAGEQAGAAAGREPGWWGAAEREPGGQVGAAVGREPGRWGAASGSGVRGGAAVEREAGGQVGAAVGREPGRWGAASGSGVRGGAAVEREAGGQVGAAVGREPGWWGAAPGSGARGEGDSGDEWESGRQGGAEPPQWPAPAGRAAR